jgi:hypothetical protein
MSPSDEDARIQLRRLEHLNVSELLFAEAEAKLRRGERVEAMELRDEAEARRRIGLAMLDEAPAAHRLLRSQGVAG